ncbi:hypothetical protein DYB30_012776, partial [Aphanomyces astaci]
LGVLLFTRGANLPGSPSLLFGYNAKERFSTWLRNTCSNSEDDIMSMGLAIADIGTHSFRKGVVSSLSNCPGGPQAVFDLAPCGVEFGQCTRHPDVVYTSEFHSLPIDVWSQHTTPDKPGRPLLVEMESTSPLQRDGSS